MIKMESYGSAISDANDAIALDPSYVKAYYRWALLFPSLTRLSGEAVLISLSEN